MSTVSPVSTLSASSNPYPERRWRLGVVFGAVWLVFLIEPASHLFDEDVPLWETSLGVGMLLLFVVCYFMAVRVPFEWHRPQRTLRFPIIMFVLALMLLPLVGESGLNTMIYVAVAMQAAWPIRAAVVGTLGLMAFTVLLCAVDPVWSASDYVFSTGAAALAMFGVVRMAEGNKRLHQAQDQLAELAVVEERERFARDLHDVLGHSLTVMTLKAELAGRLVSLDPRQAEIEVAAVERLAREALADLRATVGGYREVSLVSELSAARVALNAAGIAADLPQAVDEVPGEQRELFGWIVREGVTNVVRHSHASQCTVRVGTDSVEIIDNGPGAPLQNPTGHGLLGLRERVMTAGGRLDAGPCPEGGYALRVSIPDCHPERVTTST